MQCMRQPGTCVSAETYFLAPELTLHQVGDMREQLIQAYARGVRRFDLGRLEALDGAGAQLLLSLLKTAEADGEPIEWSEVSGAVTRTLSTLGLDDLARTGTRLTRTKA